MTITNGTNAGFVTTRPSGDPGGTSAAGGIDTYARVTKDTSPSTAAKIVEVGWYCANATEEANYEVGLYAADGAVVPGEAGTLLEVSRTNAKGTSAGWVYTTVDWDISASTVYWIGVQLDDTATGTATKWYNSGGAGIDLLTSQTTLPDPFGGGALADADGIYAFYAIWEAAATATSINIGDTWKEISWTSCSINIGDTWKDIIGVSINIGDTWKTVAGTP